MAPRAGLEHLFQNLRHRHSCLLVPFLTSFSARAVFSWVKAGRNASLNTPFHKSSPLSLRPGLLTTEDRPGRPSQTIRLGASRPLLWNLLSSVCWWLEAGKCKTQSTFLSLLLQRQFIYTHNSVYRQEVACPIGY